ncbi:S-locus glycoprotein domain-containing protein [Artemisia annua]|uniref:S-locus glycoprotein domain-containing protein n=1 Tax=Artemisia annua TaxID=35608 RepID=A0A2U1NIP1_ARTAN|nr:S-locus glycoprotein domain-containing protein [Artemisia annua]
MSSPMNPPSSFCLLSRGSQECLHFTLRYVKLINLPSDQAGSSSDPAGPSDLPSDKTAAKENGGSKIKIILLTVIPGILLIGFSILLLWYARMKKNHTGRLVKGKKLKTIG